MPILRIVYPRPYHTTDWSSADFMRVQRVLEDFTKNRRQSMHDLRDGKVFNTRNTHIEINAKLTSPGFRFFHPDATPETEFIEVRVVLYWTTIAAFRVTRNSVRIWNDGWSSPTTAKRVRQAKSWFSGFGINANHLSYDESIPPLDPALLQHMRMIQGSVMKRDAWYSKHHINHFGRKFFYGAPTIQEMCDMMEGKIIRCHIKSRVRSKKLSRTFRGVHTKEVTGSSILDLYLSSLGLRKERSRYFIPKRYLTPERLLPLAEHLPSGVSGEALSAATFAAWMKFQQFNVCECELVTGDVEYPKAFLTRRVTSTGNKKFVTRY